MRLFSQKLLDYEVDSDDEWEEEEPGESLSHSEGVSADWEQRGFRHGPQRHTALCHLQSCLKRPPGVRIWLSALFGATNTCGSSGLEPNSDTPPGGHICVSGLPGPLHASCLAGRPHSFVFGPPRPHRVYWG